MSHDLRQPVMLVRCWLLLAFLLVSFAARAAPLAVELKGEARAHYESGRMLFESGDPAGARLKFERAYELSRHVQLLWNVAVCYRQERKYTEVKRYTERYLQEGGKKLSANDRRQAQALLEAVAALVTPVEIESRPAGADVVVDGKRLGTTPLKVELDVGNHQVELSLRGFKTASRELRAVGSEPAKLLAELSPADARLSIHTLPNATIHLGSRVLSRGGFDGEVPPGKYVVRISADGYVPYRRDVQLEPGKRMSLSATLEKSSSRWPWIAAGGGAAVAIGIGLYAVLHASGSDEKGPERPSQTFTPTLGSVNLP